MRTGGLSAVAAWVARYGGEARVVAPPELVEQVQALHRAALARYLPPPD